MAHVIPVRGGEYGRLQAKEERFFSNGKCEESAHEGVLFWLMT